MSSRENGSRSRVPRWRLSASSPIQRASSSPSQWPIRRTFSPVSSCVHSVLPKPSLVACDHGRCGGKDMGRGAVVLLQPDDLRALEILLEAQDVAHLGPAPAIDRLIVVAHAADVPVTAGQQAQPEVLGDVGVLIFVHQDVAEPAAILVQDVVVGLEDADDVQQQVAEIDGVQGQQPVLIFAVEGDALAVERPRFGRRNLFGGPGAVFPVVDDAGQHPRRPLLLVDVRSQDQLLEQADLVVRVQNGEIRFQVQIAGAGVDQADRRCRGPPVRRAGAAA